MDKLTNLEKEFYSSEYRFKEVTQTIGTIQTEGMKIGFKRPLFHVLIKVIMPMPFAVILTFVDTIWIAVLALIGLFLGYFILQLYFVKANTNGRELMNCGMFLIVGYISVLLLIEGNSE